MTCKDCLHFNVCRCASDRIISGCTHFTDRSEWVHLPDEEYTFTVRGDIAKGIIIANCRAAEKVLEKKRNE